MNIVYVLWPEMHSYSILVFKSKNIVLLILGKLTGPAPLRGVRLARPWYYSKLGYAISIKPWYIHVFLKKYSISLQRVILNYICCFLWDKFNHKFKTFFQNNPTKKFVFITSEETYHFLKMILSLFHNPQVYKIAA